MKNLAILGICGLAMAILPAQAQVMDIMPLGDSITDDYNVPGSYRTQLATDLAADHYAFNFVGSQPGNSSAYLNSIGETHQEGHTGYRIDQLYNNLTGNDGTGGNNGGHWLDGGNGTGRGAITPDIILLHIGTNDASQGENAVQIGARLTTLLDDLKFDLPHVQVIVASLILRTDNSALESVEEQYNAEIPGIVAGEGSNFHFLDMHSVLGAGDLADGLHPNQAGYNKMGNAWASAVLAVPEPSTYAMMLGGLALLGFGLRRRLA